MLNGILYQFLSFTSSLPIYVGSAFMLTGHPFFIRYYLIARYYLITRIHDGLNLSQTSDAYFQGFYFRIYNRCGVKG